MITHLMLIKEVHPFIDDFVLDVPVKINGVNYRYEYGLGWKLVDLEAVRVRNDCIFKRYYK